MGQSKALEPPDPQMTFKFSIPGGGKQQQPEEIVYPPPITLAQKRVDARPNAGHDEQERS
jgi:hypothetical protein